MKTLLYKIGVYANKYTNIKLGSKDLASKVFWKTERMGSPEALCPSQILQRGGQRELVKGHLETKQMTFPVLQNTINSHYETFPLFTDSFQPEKLLPSDYPFQR